MPKVGILLMLISHHTKLTKIAFKIVNFVDMRTGILKPANIATRLFIFPMILLGSGNAQADPIESSLLVEKNTPYIVRSETIRVVTAYNAGDPAQTDDTPCIAANGENICKALEKGKKRCAANFVPLGSSLYVDKVGVCLVTDRTNKRYRNRVDIAMQKNEYQKARRFGRQKLTVKIIDISHEPHHNVNANPKNGFKAVASNPAKVEALDTQASKAAFEGGVLTSSVEADSAAGESVGTRLQPSSTSSEALRPSAMF